MSAQHLTQVAQDYIKVIWSLKEWTDGEVSVTELAERLGVGAPTVSETVRRLAGQGLVQYRRYGSVSLTDLGEQRALAMVRRHRLLETYLVSELGYTWDEVHNEAEVLEHAVTDQLIDRIDARLGFPTRDPHGDPIPCRDGKISVPQARPLSVMTERTGGTVNRIADHDPEVLRNLAALGFGLDAQVHVVARNKPEGTIDIDWFPKDQPHLLASMNVGLRAADAIWIVIP